MTCQDFSAISYLLLLALLIVPITRITSVVHIGVLSSWGIPIIFISIVSTTILVCIWLSLQMRRHTRPMYQVHENMRISLEKFK
jgi:putative effector of murein hydrolase LrgA (UPF0299 family)